MKKTARGVEADESRAAALRELPTDRGQRSVVRIGGVSGDAVVAAIRAVHEPAVRRDRDLGGRAVAGEVRRQRGDHLNRRQRSAPGVPAAGGDRAVELVEHPDDRKLRVKCQMAGTCTRAGLHAIRFGRGKPAARGVEAEHEHAIEPLVRHQHEPA